MSTENLIYELAEALKDAEKALERMKASNTEENYHWLEEKIDKALNKAHTWLRRLEDWKTKKGITPQGPGPA